MSVGLDESPDALDLSDADSFECDAQGELYLGARGGLGGDEGVESWHLTRSSRVLVRELAVVKR